MKSRHCGLLVKACGPSGHSRHLLKLAKAPSGHSGHLGAKRGRNALCNVSRHVRRSPFHGAVVDKPAKHARRSRDAVASHGAPSARHHPGRHHRRDQFAGDEQAGWAAGVDGRRNGQGCPGWRGWRSRWRRSRSICGASRRQGRHRARRRLGACRRLTLWHTRSPGRVIRAGSLLTHGSSCLIGDDIFPGAQRSRRVASPIRSSDDDDNTPCLGPSRSGRAPACGRRTAATKAKSMPTALHYSSVVRQSRQVVARLSPKRNER